MIHNVGRIDQIVRLLVSLVLVILFFTDTITGTWGYVALALAVIFTATALTKTCPIWMAMKINTLKKSVGK